MPPTLAGERGVLLSACVTNSNVFVAMTADGVASPSGGRFKPASAGWFRGPSAFGTIHACVPLRRSNAVMRPYGGFMSGKPRGPFMISRMPAR